MKQAVYCSVVVMYNTAKVHTFFIPQKIFAIFFVFFWSLTEQQHSGRSHIGREQGEQIGTGHVPWHDQVTPPGEQRHGALVVVDPQIIAAAI